MPVVCHECNTANPSESRFCYRCGVALSPGNAALHPLASRRREPRIRDIGADLKTLGVDVATYSGPRIRRGSVFVWRNVGTLVTYTAPRIKRGVVGIAGNLKDSALRLKSRINRSWSDRPERTTPAFQTHTTNSETQVAVASTAAITCPRCRSISEAGSLFCFTCGLPLDDVEPVATPAYAGQPAGFWVRFWAWLIDFLILSVADSGLIAVWPGFSDYFSSGSLLHWVDLLFFVLGCLYYAIGVSVWSTTVGKLVLRLYVRRPNGARVGFGRALGRYFASIFSLLIFGIGYLMIGLRSDKRGLHDLICDTQVVRR